MITVPSRMRRGGGCASVFAIFEAYRIGGSRDFPVIPCLASPHRQGRRPLARLTGARTAPKIW